MSAVQASHNGLWRHRPSANGLEVSKNRVKLTPDGVTQRAIYPMSPASTHDCALKPSLLWVHRIGSVWASAPVSPKVPAVARATIGRNSEALSSSLTLPAIPKFAQPPPHRQAPAACGPTTIGGGRHLCHHSHFVAIRFFSFAAAESLSLFLKHWPCGTPLEVTLPPCRILHMFSTQLARFLPSMLRGPLSIYHR